MEDRTLLSSVSWNGDAHDNNWDTPGNWSTGGVPGAGDDVTISVAANVVHSSHAADEINSLTSSQPVTISGGSLSVASTLTTTSTLTISGGTLQDASAITVGGLLTLSGGTLSGLATPGAHSGTGTLAAGGGITLDPAGGFFALDGETLTNTAGQTATYSGSGSLDELDGASFVNHGTFLAQGDGIFTNENNGGDPVSFRDDGSFVRSVDTDSLVINGVAMQVASPGTVDVKTGTLELASSTTSTGGAFTVESGAMLAFAGTTALDAGSSIGGAGTVETLGGTMTMAGTYDVTGASDFHGGSDSFTGPVQGLGSKVTTEGGKASFAGPFQGTAGTIDTVNLSGGELDFGPKPLAITTLTIGAGTLQDSSAVTVGGPLTLSSGTLSGLAAPGAKSATWTLAADGGITLNPVGGFFALDGETLTNTAGHAVTFPGAGNIDELDGAAFVNHGTFLAQGDSVFTNENNGGDPVAFRNDGTFTLSAGTTALAFNGVLLDVSSSGSVDVKAGALQIYTGGASTGGAFTVESGATLLFAGTSSFTVDGATTFGGAGTLEKQGATLLTIPGSGPSFSGPTEASQGTLLVDGSLPSSPVTVVAGGTFGGSGSAGAITSSGTVSPGDGSGILTAHADVTLNSGSQLDISIDGVTPGTGFTQLVVNGTATITGSHLNVAMTGFTPAPGESFPIITSTAAIVGTFNGLPEGSTVNVNGVIFDISYVGGSSGHDVVLSLPAVQTTASLHSSAPQGSSYGQSVTFTATVTANAGTPTGSVIFTLDGVAQTPVPLQIVGGVDEASLPSIASLSAGAHTIGASFSGDTGFEDSTAQPLAQQVAAVASTVTLSSSAPGGSSFGQGVTFTATVGPDTAAGTPTGSVTFTIDGVARTPVPLQVVGGVDQASLPPIASLTGGAHTIGASYSGDTAFSPVFAPTITQQVSPVASTIGLVSSTPSGLAPGQSVTFTAIVSPGTGGGVPTGSVTFTIDGVAQTPVPLRVVDGIDQAVLPPVRSLSVATHTIGASYDGDTNYTASTAQPWTQSVVSAVQTSVTEIHPAPNSSTFGQAVTLTVTVTANPSSNSPGSEPGGAASQPTGTVTIAIDGKDESPIPLRIVGGVAQATLTVSTLAVGRHSIVASYSGDAEFGKSTSVATTQTVTAATPTIGLATTTPTAVDQEVRHLAPTVVSMKRYGVRKQPTTLVLKLSAALDPTRADDPQEYRLIRLGKPGAPFVGHAIRLRGVSYNPSTSTVSLRPVHPLLLHRRFRLIVDGSAPGGLADPTGQFLNGSGSGAGSDFQMVLTRKQLAGPAQKVVAAFPPVSGSH